MFKYILALIFFISAFSFCKAEKIKIVASTSIIGDITTAIAGDYVDIKLLVPVGGDPHNYEPIPSDMKKLQTADFILKNGLGLEGWISDLYTNSGTKAPLINCTKNISAITSDTYKDSSDPHVWMNPLNGIIYAKNIYSAIEKKLDASQKEITKQKLDTYIKDLNSLDLYITKEIQSIPENQRTLITNHDAFKYYGRKYGLELASVLGITTEADVQTGDIIRVAEAIKKTKVPSIFVETTINPQLIEQIAKDNHVEIGGSLYSDSLGKKGSDGDTYLKMLRANTDKIVRGLTKSNTQVINEKEKSNILYPVLIGSLLLAAFLFLFMKMNRNYE